MKGVGGAECERGRGQRCDWIEAGAREPLAPEGLDREPADREANHGADRELSREQAEHVDNPVARFLDPVDEANHEQDRDGIVHSRLALQRSRKPPVERRAAEHREDRGDVRGGQDRAEQKAFEEREVEEPGCGQSRDQGGDQRTHESKAERGPQDRADLVEPACEPALEEDQTERDHAHRASELVVVEVDPAGAVRPDRHPDAEEEEQRGDA
jgi:hypothetical protein